MLKRIFAYGVFGFFIFCNLCLALGQTIYTEKDFFTSFAPADDAVVFAYDGPGAGLFTLFSPLRDSLDPAQDYYAPVNSKYGQPRTESVNPHIGVDLRTVSTEFPTGRRPVYPVWIGRVVFTGGDYGTVAIQLDINGDGIYDNLYATYSHLSQINVVRDQVIRAADLNTSIGISGDTGVPGSPHLHFELRRFDGALRLSIRPSVYYESIFGWNGGRDLEFISDIAWINSRTAKAFIYTMDNGIHRDVNYGDVILFHRQSGSLTWNRSFMNKNGDLFSGLSPEFNQEHD